MEDFKPPRWYRVLSRLGLERLDPHPFVLWLAGVAVLAPIGWLLGTYVPDLDSWTDPPSSGWETALGLTVGFTIVWVLIQFERDDD